MVSKNARGSFEVKVGPQPADEKVGDPTVGRLSIDKQYHGDLDAFSKGQMLAVGTDVKGSAGYVAMERVDGSLQGRKGTFALQHSGTMTRGSGQLVGLAGKMDIKIADGKHLYELEYSLPDAM
jgi:hypothetical protein